MVGALFFILLVFIVFELDYDMGKQTFQNFILCNDLLAKIQ